MNIILAVEVTLRRRMRNSRAQMRWAGWLVRAAGVVFLLLGALASFDVALLVPGLLYLFGPELLGALRHARARRYGRVYTFTLTDENVTIRTAITNLEFTWDAVKSIRQTATTWDVRLPGGGFFVLPKEFFSPDQAAEWQAFLAGRGVVAV